MSRLQSEYSSIMSELTRSGFPLSADRIRYIVKLHSQRDEQLVGDTAEQRTIQEDK